MYRVELDRDSFGQTRFDADRRPARIAATMPVDVRPGPPPAAAVMRGLDVVLAAAASIVFLPVVAIVAAAIKLEDGGPVLFCQERIGHRGKRFRCWKFRSMCVDAEARLAEILASDPQLRDEWETDRKLKVDPRITRIGEFLRKTSLDELPQLFNILRGEMSVVGPRPIVASEIACYDRWYRYYTAVKPGLTGLWQVSGRNDVSYRRRVAMDRFFSRMHSLELYAFIVLATLPAVLLRRGSY